MAGNFELSETAFVPEVNTETLDTIGKPESPGFQPEDPEVAVIVESEEQPSAELTVEGATDENTTDTPKLDAKQRLSAQEEQRLFLRLQKGDELAGSIIFEAFLPMAKWTANRFKHIESLEDLEQIAAIGLIRAIEKFDPSRGNKFSSFAVPTMRGEIIRHIRDHTWVVHMPRGLQELALRVLNAQKQIEQKNNGNCTIPQIAELLQISEDEVKKGFQVWSSRNLDSLDEPLQANEEDFSIGDRIKDPNSETEFELSLVKGDLQRAMQVLPDRERTVLYLRFVEDLTQKEIGKRIGISQVHAGRLLQQSLEILKSYLDTEEAYPEAA